MFKDGDTRKRVTCIIQFRTPDCANREDGPFVVRLAREPGKRESRYMHLFSGEVEDQPAVTDMSNAVDGDLQARVEALEIEVAELKQRLDSLLAHLGD